MSMELIDKRKLIEKVKTFHKWNLYTDNFPLIPSKRYGVGYLADNVLFGIDSEPTVKAIPKDQYETRLKADMVAMLTEIQLEIEELDTSNNNCAYLDCADIIQQKIDKLKEVDQ